MIALLEPAIEFFREVSIRRLPHRHATGRRSSSRRTSASSRSIVGTLSVTFWAILVAVPFGLGSAIYLSEYARPRTRKILKPALEVLAGIPTVVFGYFALTFFTPLLRDIGVQVDIFNALAAGLVIGVMLIPTVASLSEDAMTAVPQALRDGAYGLGSNRMQVSLRVVVPAAISGIVASFVLAISRAVGETMIVLLAAGQQPVIDWNPLHARRDDDRLHRRDRRRRRPDRLARVQDDLRRRPHAVRRDARR